MQAGEAAAITELVSINRPLIKGFIHIFHHDKYHADAILSEVNVAVWKNINGFKGDSEFSTWLFTITKRTAIAYIRKNKLPMRITYDVNLLDNFTYILPEQNDSDNPLSILVNTEMIKAVRAAIAKLPELQGIAITLRYLVGCSIAETAELMERRSESSVKSLTTRGIESLRSLLEEYRNDYGGEL